MSMLSPTPPTFDVDELNTIYHALTEYGDYCEDPLVAKIYAHLNYGPPPYVPPVNTLCAHGRVCRDLCWECFGYMIETPHFIEHRRKELWRFEKMEKLRVESIARVRSDLERWAQHPYLRASSAEK